MGLDPDIRTDQMKSYTSGLLSNVVTMDLPNKGYVQYPLFSEAKCEYDEKSGQVTISIDCNPKLKQAFFDLANDGYVRYQLKNVINMRSQYSIKLYSMLKDKHFGWTVEVEDLRKKLGATSATYKEFKRFNSLVLKKAIDEINSITDIEVDTENIRKGRVVVAIKFSIKERPQVLDAGTEEVEEQMALDDFVDVDHKEIYEPDDPLALAASMLPPEFTREQVQLLMSLATEHMPYTVASFAEKEIWIADYLHSKVQLMKADPTVKSQFGWLKNAVAQNWK